MIYVKPYVVFQQQNFVQTIIVEKTKNLFVGSGGTEVIAFTNLIVLTFDRAKNMRYH